MEVLSVEPGNDINDLKCFEVPLLKVETDSKMDGIITEEMIEIENKLEKQTCEEVERLEKQMDGDEEEEKEKRYKMLMHLLSRSKFYTEFMLKKLDDSLKNPPPLSSRTKVGGNSKKEKSSESVSSHNLRERNDNTSTEGPGDVPPFRRAVSKPKGSENASRNKRKLDFDIAELIDKETISDVEKKRKLLPEQEAEDTAGGGASKQQEETRETAYGIKVPARQPELFEGGALKPYQLDGLEWLKVLYLNGVNGILADEMGLGKTPQTIALLCHLIEMGISGPFLVIAPLSTLPNWILEFERFAPQVPVVLFHGNVEKRRKMYVNLRRKQRVTDSIAVFPVVLTSYEIPLRDSILQKTTWKYLVVDEGHRLKNHKCLLARELRKYKTANRLLLTGTPLQNNLSELWSLLNFLLPEIFSNLAAFETWFDLSVLQQADSSEKIIMQEKEKNVLSIMHQILAPFLLRRVKADVDLNIPPKKEVIVYAPMSKIQLELYRATVEHNYSKLLKKEEESVIIPDQPDGKRAKRKTVLMREGSRRFLEDEENHNTENSKYDIVVQDKEDKNYKIQLKMSNPMMQLRKIVNHPYLVHFPLVPGKKELKIDEGLIKKSGKLEVLDAMLQKLKQKQHKVLIFSTFTTLLDLLEEYVIMRKYEFVRLDGNVSIDDRQQRIKDFNKDPNIFLFLISTRAGGLGINLTSADTVIIYDSDWNPQVDLQAQDRCHRIGQTKPVVVYRFVTAGTVDEDIVDRAAAKRKLEKMIIQKGKFKMSQKSSDAVNLKELLEVLNSRDYEKKIHSNGYVFTDEELEELLDRSDMVCAGTQSKSSMSDAKDSKVYKVVDQQR